MAGGIVMVAFGLWVVLQSTKGPLVSKLGLIAGSKSSSSTSTTKSSSSSSSPTTTASSSSTTSEIPGAEGLGLPVGVASRYVG